jgi:hypothetical protein
MTEARSEREEKKLSRRKKTVERRVEDGFRRISLIF